jgi:hypothetical protein
MDEEPKKKPKIVYLSNLVLFSSILTAEMLVLTIVSFVVGNNLLKRAIVGGLSALVFLFWVFIGRKAMGGKWPVKPGQSIGITFRQVLWVTPLVVGVGIFVTWLIFAEF